MDKEESDVGVVPQLEIKEDKEVVISLQTKVPEESEDAVRPKRDARPTEKGRAYNVSTKIKLFETRRTLLVKAISTAVEELNKEKPIQEVLAKARVRITHMRNELGDMQSSLVELGSGDVVSEAWDSAQLQAQEVISNIVLAIAIEAGLPGSVKARSRLSSRTSSRRSARSRVSNATSQQSAVSSAISLRLQMKLEAASLSVKREGQITEDDQQRRLDSVESEEASRRAEETARSIGEDVARRAAEATRRAEEAARGAAEAARKADSEAEETFRRAEFERKKKESLRQIETVRMDTAIKSNLAMLSVLDQAEASPPEPPALPLVNLLESHFHPSASQPLAFPRSVSPPVDLKTVTVGTGSDAAAGAQPGTHLPVMSATSVPSSEMGAVRVLDPSAPPAASTSCAGGVVDVAPAASASYAGGVVDVAPAAATSYAGGVVDVAPAPSTSYAGGVMDVAPAFRNAVNSTLHVPPGALSVAAAGRGTGPPGRQQASSAVSTDNLLGPLSAAYLVSTERGVGTPGPPNAAVSVYRVGTAHTCTQLSTAVIYTTASQTRMSTQRHTSSATLQHPLGVFAASAPANYSFPASSLSACTPSTGRYDRLPGITEVPEPRSSLRTSVDWPLHVVPQPLGPYSVFDVNGCLRPEAEAFVPMPAGTQQYAPPFQAQHVFPIDSLTRTLSDALMLNRLPLQEPCIFTGDPLLYPTWRIAFSFLIERQRIAPSEKLLYLQRYLGGQAKEAVAGFFLLRDLEAYEKAMSVLEKRFGNSYVVAQAFRTKLDDWAIVKSRDCTGLRRLADFLQQCAVAAKEVGGLGILDDAQYLKRIINKLPDWMVHRWCRAVSRTKLDHGRYPRFEELVKFVTLEADIINDPVFGAGAPSLLPAKLSAPPLQATPAKKLSLATQSEVVATCEFCSLPSHAISQCDSFAKKTSAEKRNFIFKTNLCFGCLKSKEHKSRQCNDRETCASCNRKHPTCLHDKDFVYRKQGVRGGDNQGGVDQKTGSAAVP
jgi:hypothetical protein